MDVDELFGPYPSFKDRTQYQIDLTKYTTKDSYKVESEDGNLVTSELKQASQQRYRAPVLDLDVDHEYVPSTTEGHGHLYLNITITKEEEQELLEVLARLGIIEEGFKNASVDRGFTAVRKPGVLKTEAERKISSNGWHA